MQIDPRHPQIRKKTQAQAKQKYNTYHTKIIQNANELLQQITNINQNGTMNSKRTGRTKRCLQIPRLETD